MFKKGDRVRLRQLAKYPPEAATAVRYNQMTSQTIAVVVGPSNWKDGLTLIQIPKIGQWHIEDYAIEHAGPKRNLPSWW